MLEAVREKRVGKGKDNQDDREKVEGQKLLRVDLSTVLREHLSVLPTAAYTGKELGPVVEMILGRGIDPAVSVQQLYDLFLLAGVSPSKYLIPLSVPAVVTRLTFAERLRELRAKAGLSQEELAAKAGVSSGAVKQWEAAKRQPSLPALQKIVKALGGDLTLFNDVVSESEDAE